MKEKLILKHRGDFDYFLVSRTDNSEALVASLSPDEEVFEQKLSKQNCDEIFGVVDVEEIADIHTFGQRNHEWKAYIAGFNKAMELNKDKVFTLEDIKKAYIQGKHGGKTQAYVEFDDYIQSLQQPTEIEVEIEMRPASLVYKSNLVIEELDSEGCLILKKI
jgi:hypothetical protein